MVSFFFFIYSATTEIYTLSLHDALPISELLSHLGGVHTRDNSGSPDRQVDLPVRRTRIVSDRKSTRLNSSHANISYAVFCLKKKKKTPITLRNRRRHAVYT